MDYPLSRSELQAITSFIEHCNENISASKENRFIVEFLFSHRYLMPGAYTKGLKVNFFAEGTDGFILAGEKDMIIAEIKSCNAKAKANTKREWKIGISSAVIGGIFGIISALISVNLIG